MLIRDKLLFTTRDILGQSPWPLTLLFLAHHDIVHSFFHKNTTYKWLTQSVITNCDRLLDKLKPSVLATKYTVYKMKQRKCRRAISISLFTERLSRQRCNRAVSDRVLCRSLTKTADVWQMLCAKYFLDTFTRKLHFECSLSLNCSSICIFTSAYDSYMSWVAN